MPEREKAINSRIQNAKPGCLKLSSCLIQKKVRKNFLKLVILDSSLYRFCISMCIYIYIHTYVYLYTHNYKGISQKLGFSFSRFTIFLFNLAFGRSQYRTSVLHNPFPLWSVLNLPMTPKIDETPLKDVHITWPCEALITLLLDINAFLSSVLTSH